jgi:hypothetical protein
MFGLALPHGEHGPSSLTEQSPRFAITIQVLGKLPTPKNGIGDRRRFAAYAAVSVPEAPVNENNLATGHEDKIGHPG